MTTRIAESSPCLHAHVAGLLYLSLGLFAPFSLLYVPSRLLVPGDVAATASNIMANASLFRLGMVSALVTSIVTILVVLAFYQTLKPVNKNMAVLMVIFLLVAVPIGMLSTTEVNVVKAPPYLIPKGKGEMSMVGKAQ